MYLENFLKNGKIRDIKVDTLDDGSVRELDGRGIKGMVDRNDDIALASQRSSHGTVNEPRFSEPRVKDDKRILLLLVGSLTARRELLEVAKFHLEWIVQSVRKAKLSGLLPVRGCHGGSHVRQCHRRT
jgi:hypothetical protein